MIGWVENSSRQEKLYGFLLICVFYFDVAKDAMPNGGEYVVDSLNLRFLIVLFFFVFIVDEE